MRISFLFSDVFKRENEKTKKNCITSFCVCPTVCTVHTDRDGWLHKEIINFIELTTNMVENVECFSIILLFLQSILDVVTMLCGVWRQKKVTFKVHRKMKENSFVYMINYVTFYVFPTIAIYYSLGSILIDEIWEIDYRNEK